MKSSDSRTFRLSPRTKMADAISHFNILLTVLPRLGIPLGFGERSIEDLCTEHSVSVPLFMLICNVYAYDEYHPSREELEQCRTNDLVEYLLSSHKDYIDNKMPHIEKHFQVLLTGMEEKHRLLISNFYKKLKNEIMEHFSYEENMVFPYLRQFSKDTPQKTVCNNEEFYRQHDDIEDALKDLTTLMLKYIPSETATVERVDMLLDMYSLASDIKKHAMLENRILVPFIQLLKSRKND